MFLRHLYIQSQAMMFQSRLSMPYLPKQYGPLGYQEHWEVPFLGECSTITSEISFQAAGTLMLGFLAWYVTGHSFTVIKHDSVSFSSYTFFLGFYGELGYCFATPQETMVIPPRMNSNYQLDILLFCFHSFLCI